ARPAPARARRRVPAAAGVADRGPRADGRHQSGVRAGARRRLPGRDRFRRMELALPGAQPRRGGGSRLRRRGRARRAPRAAGSAGATGPLSAWIGLAAARTRRTASGAVLGERERLGAETALALFTTRAADSLSAPALGRLRPGGPADLVVVEPDPLRASPDELADARVRLTMIAGEVVWAV